MVYELHLTEVVIKTVKVKSQRTGELCELSWWLRAGCSGPKRALKGPGEPR